MQYDDAQRDTRLFPYALATLLVLAFLTGGSSIVSGWDDAFVQLLALPVLAWGLWRLPALPASRTRTVVLVVAAAIATVPLVQLLPLPKSLWLIPDARRQLAADLAIVGASPQTTWSLAPGDTERAFLFLLPPIALFVGALTVGRETHRRLLRTVMLLALFSLVLAFLQLGVPAESVLNPFPQWAYQFNGVFANQNHQAISMVVGIAIALAGMLAALPRAREGLRQAWAPWALGFAALFALCALPLTQSRGAVLIGTFVVAAVPQAMGLFDRRHLRQGWGARAGLAACIALVGLGIWATIGWMQVDVVDELRRPMRDATSALGGQHAPWGSGVGAFVQAFAQGAPTELLFYSYINHAHNEYLQWWLESGWLGGCVATASVAVCLAISIKALRSPTRLRGQIVASCLGLCALLAHSWVDYPLRTVSIASVAAVLAAVLATCVSGRRVGADAWYSMNADRPPAVRDD